LKGVLKILAVIVMVVVGVFGIVYRPANRPRVFPFPTPEERAEMIGEAFIRPMLEEYIAPDTTLARQKEIEETLAITSSGEDRDRNLEELRDIRRQALEEGTP